MSTNEHYSNMNSDKWLVLAESKLTVAGIGTARIDSLVLLEDITQKDKAWLLAHPEHKLNWAQQKRLSAQLSQREGHMPLAYIRGKTEFFGRDFVVNQRVLEPRPESETMIELLKSLDLPSNPHIADIGSGCGALGITAALEISRATVHLYEIDPLAMLVAKRNANRYHLHLQTILGDLLTVHQGPYDVLLCNLPYVPDHYTINEAAAMEPRIAIFGGSDGLDLYRRLFDQLESFDWQPRFVLCESMPMLHAALVTYAKAKGFTLSKTEDFIQVFTPA